MLLPDKHVKISESILGLSALVVSNIDGGITFDKLMGRLVRKFETPEWPAYHNTETVALALCFLYTIGLVDVTKEGDLFRCD